ncbi:MAG: DNA repair exonuclease [Cyanobacteria bacterium K_DeepCast_35m_m2_155]|nr:DNA repair exonuclease [Cyanobacteria bacterium K_DeepCast_35m_m2_155]
MPSGSQSQVTVLHTADWQIGKPYGRVMDPDKRSRLRQLRLDAISRIAELATNTAASAVVVAGDLFDSPTPAASEVSAVCAAIGTIACPTLVVPGNHDHGGAGSIWQSPVLEAERRRRAPQLVVLQEPTPYELEELVVLPCGLKQRHDNLDPCAWLGQLDWASLPGDKPRLVLAHGGVNGFGASDLDDENPSGPVNLINLKAAWLEQVDYVALGDWHGCKQVQAKAWYSGTPEPDRFARSADYQSGLVLEVALQRGALPLVRPHSTGTAGWHALQMALSSDTDLQQLERQLDQMLSGRVGLDLLLLELEGTLSIGAQQQLEALLQRFEAQLLRLKRRGTVGISPEAAELQALGQLREAPLVAAVVRQLQQQLQDADQSEQRALLSEALLELHRSTMGPCN